jgi:hypothetical protein
LVSDASPLSAVLMLLPAAVDLQRVSKLAHYEMQYPITLLIAVEYAIHTYAVNCVISYIEEAMQYAPEPGERRSLESSSEPKLAVYADRVCTSAMQMMPPMSTTTTIRPSIACGRKPLDLKGYPWAFARLVHQAALPWTLTLSAM